MISTPVFVYVSLRSSRTQNNLFSDAEAEVMEQTCIIPVYDCYYHDAPQEKRGDKYCHYYIRNYVKTTDGAKSEFVSMIDPNLKVCCRNGELFYSDSRNKFFRRIEGTVKLLKYPLGRDAKPEIIGTLEEMNITM